MKINNPKNYLALSRGVDGSVKRDCWPTQEGWVAKSRGIVGLVKRDGWPTVKRDGWPKIQPQRRKRVIISKAVNDGPTILFCTEFLRLVIDVISLFIQVLLIKMVFEYSSNTNLELCSILGLIVAA
jgi:hypothetical protein